MPGGPAGPGPDHLILVERLRLLSCEFEIRTNSADFLSRLAYVAQHAEQSLPVASRHEIEVMWTGDTFRVSEDGAVVGADPEPSAALELLHDRMHRRALGGLPDHIRIHAASAMHAGRTFLIVGPKRAGKTTLALRLVAEGYDVTGDELVLLRDREVVAFPRKFFVREGSLALLPAVRALTRTSPFVANPIEGRLIAVDPTRFDRPWRIVPSPVSAILFIEPNHGGATTLAPCRKVEMVSRVLAECTPPESGRAGWIGDLCRTVDDAATMTLHLGDLDAAMLAVASILR